MSPEQSKALHDRFPALFPEKVWFYCGDGWYGVLEKLFSDIVEHAEAAGISPAVVSVQGKYGSLRVGTSEEDRHIRLLLHDAEDASEKTCEICGAPGTLLDDGVWIKTRCRWHVRR